MRNSKSKRMNVMVVGCCGTAGLNVIRCLKRSAMVKKIIGVDVDFPFGMAPVRGAEWNEAVKIPRIGNRSSCRMTCLADAVEEHGVHAVFVQPDAELAWLSSRLRVCGQSGFTDWVGALPLALRTVPVNQALLERLSDKWRVQVCRDETACPFDSVDLGLFNWVKGDVGKVWMRTRHGAGSRGGMVVAQWEHATAWVDMMGRTAGVSKADWMVSRYLPGPEYAVQMVYFKGKLRALESRERLSYLFGEESPTGQTSTASAAVPVDVAMITGTAIGVLENLVDTNLREGFFGVNIRLNENRNPVVTEINYGRFDTTVNMFAELGVNLPELWLRLLTGEDVTLEHNTAAKQHPDAVWSRGVDRDPVMIKRH